MSALLQIAAGLLSIGGSAKTTRSQYQVGRADLATGGGPRGVVPPERTRSPYQLERADLALGGGRRGVVPPQERK
jgi:hypothetical protein